MRTRIRDDQKRPLDVRGQTVGIRFMAEGDDVGQDNVFPLANGCAAVEGWRETSMLGQQTSQPFQFDRVESDQRELLPGDTAKSPMSLFETHQISSREAKFIWSPTLLIGQMGLLGHLFEVPKLNVMPNAIW
jgi:hypothetical protein